jgi:hypothetical protein
LESESDEVFSFPYSPCVRQSESLDDVSDDLLSCLDWGDPKSSPDSGTISSKQPLNLSSVDAPFCTKIQGKSLAQYLSERFACQFEERAWVEGNMVEIQDARKVDVSSTKTRFYFSQSVVVKAYMNVLGSDRAKHLAESLHEAAATAFLCSKKNWKYEVFGVSMNGVTPTPGTHICLLRTLLDPNHLTADEAAAAFVEVLETLGVAHGDTHPKNVLKGASGVEVLDCERCFLIDRELHKEMAESIRIFAKNPSQRPALLEKFRKQGLEATRHRFILLARNILSGKLDIFSHLFINKLLQTFQNTM